MTHVHEGEWCAKCVEHGIAECVRYRYAEAAPEVPRHHEIGSDPDCSWCRTYLEASESKADDD